MDGRGARRLREPGAGLTAHILWKALNKEKAKSYLRKSTREREWNEDLPEKKGERTDFDIG